MKSALLNYRKIFYYLAYIEFVTGMQIDSLDNGFSAKTDIKTYYFVLCKNFYRLYMSKFHILNSLIYQTFQDTKKEVHPKCRIYK